MRGLAIAVATLVAGYLVVVFLAWRFQSRLVYLPHLPGRTLETTPAAAGLQFEDVAIVTTDGVRLHGWFVPVAGDVPVVLFFHGNAGNVSHRISTLALLRSMGFATLIVDYRGYGLSEGEPDEAGSYLDGLAAFDWLTDRGVDPARIVVHGRSLGAGIAIEVTTQRRAAGLIVESTFTSVPDVAARHYPLLPVRRLATIRYDNLAKIGRVLCPVLVIHSRHDEIAPLAHGEALAAAAGAKLVTLDGSHNEAIAVSQSRYAASLRQFVATVTGSQEHGDPL